MKAPPKKKITLDIPIPVVAKIKTLAIESNRSFAAMVRVLIQDALEKR